MQVVLGEAGEGARHSDDADPDSQNGSLPREVDQAADERARDKTHQRKSRNDGPDFEKADPKTSGVHRKHRDNDAETDHDKKGHHTQHIGIARKPGFDVLARVRGN